MPANTRSARSSDESMPYRYDDGGVQFGIEEFAFDGGESGRPDYDDRSLPLYEYGQWDEVTLDGTVTVNGSVDDVFPGDPPYPARLVVVVDCEPAQVRYEETVAEPPLDPETHETRIDLERQLFRDEVRLTPRLVRTEPCREGLPYAPNAGMRVAGGSTWELQVDEPARDDDGFPFVYRDFSQEGMPPAELVHSFSRSPNPKVMVNDRHEGIVDVLQTDGFYGFRPNLKSVLKAEFGTLLWVQLVVLTGTTIAEAGEPEFDWQRGVVKEVARSDMGDHLFGPDADYETVVDRLGASVADTTQLREFVVDLCEAVQLYTDHGAELNSFVEEEAP